MSSEEYILKCIQFQEDAVEKVRKGMSYGEVARMLDVNRTTVANWCKQQGVRSLHKGCHTDERIQQDIVALVQGGANYEDVAREHLMSYKTVSKICKKYGVASKQSAIMKKRNAYSK